MTKEELLKQVVPHVHKMDDDWGLGQIKIDTILIMIDVGEDIGLDFSFVKKVTALDDETYEHYTNEAFADCLFVFPSHNMDLDAFWKEVKLREEKTVFGKKLG